MKSTGVNSDKCLATQDILHSAVITEVPTVEIQISYSLLGIAAPKLNQRNRATQYSYLTEAMFLSSSDHFRYLVCKGNLLNKYFWPKILNEKSLKKVLRDTFSLGYAGIIPLAHGNYLFQRRSITCTVPRVRNIVFVWKEVGYFHPKRERNTTPSGYFSCAQ